MEELESEHAVAAKRGWASDFDPKRPWNAVWRRIVEGKHEELWWFRNVEKPATFITNRVASEGDYIEGGVMPAPPATAKSPLSLELGGSMMPLVTRGAKRPRAPSAPSYHQVHYQESLGATAYTTDDAIDLSVHDGVRWICNRHGKSFGGGWNGGSCTRTVNGNRCAVNQDEVHQCSLCKKTGHGEHNCWMAGGKPGEGKGGKATKGDKGKGKGKTKNKGKGKRDGKGNGSIQ